MQKTQRGFTLIELVATTVILGVLAAVAIPKFTDLKGDASQAAVKGVADTLTTAANANYAKRSVTGTTTDSFATVDTVITCATVAPLLLASGLPTGYTASPAVGAAAGAVLVVGNNLCTLTLTETNNTPKTAQFGVIGIL
ncbi:type II secretion system protein [Polaromonas vacuolata]|nr:type II secretion system protein [Polaromonas vacuolata]